MSWIQKNISSWSTILETEELNFKGEKAILKLDTNYYVKGNSIELSIKMRDCIYILI